ncbi:MAG: FHA domain-containing protein, partial [Pirellula sp.]
MKISLKVLSGNHEGKLIPIKEEKFFIGRGDDCHLRPKSESVSRRHCASGFLVLAIPISITTSNS